jgi:hypothetical protein
VSNLPNYACTRCLTPTKRENLVVKKSVFLEMGEGGRTIRSRVTDWLCPGCTNDDADWNREKFDPPRVVVKELIV